MSNQKKNPQIQIRANHEMKKKDDYKLKYFEKSQLSVFVEGSSRNTQKQLLSKDSQDDFDDATYNNKGMKSEHSQSSVSNNSQELSATVTNQTNTKSKPTLDSIGIDQNKNFNLVYSLGEDSNIRKNRSIPITKFNNGENSSSYYFPKVEQQQESQEQKVDQSPKNDNCDDDCVSSSANQLQDLEQKNNLQQANATGIIMEQPEDIENDDSNVMGQTQQYVRKNQVSIPNTNLLKKDSSKSFSYGLQYQPENFDFMQQLAQHSPIQPIMMSQKRGTIQQKQQYYQQQYQQQNLLKKPQSPQYQQQYQQQQQQLYQYYSNPSNNSVGSQNECNLQQDPYQPMFQSQMIMQTQNTPRNEYNVQYTENDSSSIQKVNTSYNTTIPELSEQLSTRSSTQKKLSKQQQYKQQQQQYQNLSFISTEPSEQHNSKSTSSLQTSNSKNVNFLNPPNSYNQNLQSYQQLRQQQQRYSIDFVNLEGNYMQQGNNNKQYYSLQDNQQQFQQSQQQKLQERDLLQFQQDQRHYKQYSNSSIKAQRNLNQVKGKRQHALSLYQYSQHQSQQINQQQHQSNVNLNSKNMNNQNGKKKNSRNGNNSQPQQNYNNQQKNKGKKQQSIPQENQKYYEIDLNTVEEKGFTTIMIRNIPNKYNQDLLIKTLQENCDVFNDNKVKVYDFLYLPIDQKNLCNVGYAFINFTDIKYLKPFYKSFYGFTWPKFKSDKVCKIVYARVQGLRELYNFYKDTSVMIRQDNARPYFDPKFRAQIQQLIENQKK